MLLYSVFLVVGSPQKVKIYNDDDNDDEGCHLIYGWMGVTHSTYMQKVLH